MEAPTPDTNPLRPGCVLAVSNGDVVDEQTGEIALLSSNPLSTSMQEYQDVLSFCRF